jgi:BirA family transcriptional regulator, biotin operon repressor / biotin---[acetyl-CoA-carboxylase] ligase
MPRTSSYDLARLRKGIKPFRLHWFPRLRSTNDHAIALRQRGDLYAPAIVLTGHQLAGRGRGSNAWWSGAGSLTVTFAMPIEDGVAPHQLPLIAGVAVREAVSDIIGDDEVVQLKWPNDLLVNGRKLAGLLCERAFKADLIGLGLNVNVSATDVPETLRERVTSLSQVARKEFDLTDVLAKIARHFHTALSHRREQSFAAVLKRYDAHHALVGKRVRVTATESPVSGRCEGLDSMGRLLLKDGQKLHRVIAGHVEAMDG